MRDFELSEDEIADLCFYSQRGLCRHVENPSNLCMLNVCKYWVSWNSDLRKMVNKRLPDNLKIKNNEHVEKSHLVMANIPLEILVHETY